MNAQPTAANQHEDRHFTIPGLAAPVQISVDTWGIPHIRAESLDDLFLAQGFNAARDRLWQIDLARKRGLGLLAADFGPGYLEQDRAARLFLYRGDMEAEWACYGEDAKAICTAFANGINAFIDLTDRQPDLLPAEFLALRTRPAKWQAADVVRVRSHGWVRNALSEVVRANVIAGADADTDLLRARLDPPVTPEVAPGIDLAGIPLAVLDTYKLALAPVTFSADRLAAAVDQAGSWRTVTPSGEVVADPTFQGSNNWAVAASRTATGRPILASDPHRAHAVPALRYLVHLTAPGFDAIGTGEPILPGIMIGHNGHSAFGLTLFFGPDEEDVYVYETKPGEPNCYRYQGAWESMRIEAETAAVRGTTSRKLMLKFTRHGPVIYEDPVRHRAYAVRSVVTEPGATPYGASLIAMRTRSFDAFRAAMRHWAVPAVNHVYADVTGDIGWITAGSSPVRPNWDGLLPVPGDGGFEWQGFLDPDQMPWVRNPSKGYVATANEMNVPADWSVSAKNIGFEWWEPSRATRINDVLSGQPAHRLADSQRLQTDCFSTPARRLQPLLAQLRGKPGRTARAMLSAWDCKLHADSAAAALFELWWSNHLKPALFAVLVPDPQVRALVLAPGDVESILRCLEQPESQPRLGSAAARDDLLLTSLEAAWADLTQRLGDDPAAWQWGSLHQGYFAHALNPLQSEAEAARFNVGPLPKAGGDSTPMMAAYRPSDFRVTMGASVRIVIDVGDWDRSVCINAPGQSGNPHSPHYRDLAPLWAAGQYVPMLYSREAVDAATAQRIFLAPS